MKPTQAKNHHYLPRFLLKGFASRSAGKARWVWQFSRGNPPREKNTKKVAAAPYFHGPGDIEDKLAVKESGYADLVTELRAGAVPPGKEPLVAEFVSHLIVRTKHLRDGLDSFGRIGMPAFLDALCDPANAANVRALVRKEAEETFKRLPPAERRRLEPELDRFVDEQLARFRVERQVRGDPPVSAEDSQLKALDGPITAIARTSVLEQLTWSVVQVAGGDLILGDIGPVARGEGEPLLESPLQFNSALPAAIYLPISSERLLVGQRAPGPLDPIDDINVASAELSRDFFVARCNGAREQAYHSSLGQRAEFMEPAEIKRLATDVFRGE
jgi:hypothetical protein